MIKIAVAENENGTLFDSLSENCKDIENILITRVNDGIATADIAAWGGGFGKKLPRIRAMWLVVCGEQAQEALKCCSSKYAVSFGLGARDTLTISSAEDPAMASLQRELLCTDGKIAEPREISLGGLCGPILERLCAAAVLLLLGRQ